MTPRRQWSWQLVDELLILVLVAAVCVALLVAGGDGCEWKPGCGP